METSRAFLSSVCLPSLFARCEWLRRREWPSLLLTPFSPLAPLPIPSFPFAPPPPLHPSSSLAHIPTHYISSSRQPRTSRFSRRFTFAAALSCRPRSSPRTPLPKFFFKLSMGWKVDGCNTLHTAESWTLGFVVHGPSSGRERRATAKRTSISVSANDGVVFSLACHLPQTNYDH
jgi:hypothetical protein